MNGYNQTPYRLGRRPGKQGPRPLPGNQGRVEKLATGKTDVMTRTKDTNRGTGVTTIKTNDGAQRLKITKDIFTVGTWNVQTLWTTGKLELLRNEMKRFRFDVVGISEVRWTGKGETPRGDFIWSGENTTHTKGVGLLLSTKAKKAMIGYNPISSRLISARFNATPFKITVIHVYAPTSASSEAEIEAFYDNIEKELSRTSKKDLIIITGDWNAKVGSDNTNWENTMGKYGYGDRNERGERLLEFAALHNFYICNTRFQQKPNRKWTWISPNGVHKNMIDLILIQKRWKSSVMNCRTFQSADISSDHSLVLCNIKLRLQQRQIKPQQNIFEINQLKNQATKKLYQEKLNANLQRIIETDSIDEHATKIERAIEEALQTTITTTKRAKNPWISEQTLNLADEKRRVKQIKSTSTQNAKLYKDLCNRVRKSARQDKEKWIQDKCDEIEKGLNVGNTRQAYSLIKTLKKKFVPRTTAIKNEDGTMAQSKDNAQSAVRVDKEIGEWFHTSVGTRQGDPLSPLLFITYLERVMDKAIQTDSGISISGTLVNNLRFADDINMIQEDRNMLLKQTERLQTVATQAGLTINTGKTKTLVFGGPNIEQPIKIAGNRTGPVPPGTRSETMEKHYPISGWPQRVINPWDIVNRES
ncbi:unnamed protein product [Rotaria magnacalcarata]|uniref:Endonuclease/exonuclease/phosphatase domain-containing protein n=1 Tax=Rotaria magnacalcarata TaxID=392030 RepID=A0A819ZPC7_9BILA|nr:unnamed protein product [Rotaria magnacalcarata]